MEPLFSRPEIIRQYYELAWSLPGVQFIGRSDGRVLPVTIVFDVLVSNSVSRGNV
jgi:hypothetical protein